jgi:excinuclease ABC subunit C
MDNLEKHSRMIDLSGIPDNPGCYIYSDNTGKVIYVGKARNLKKRVKSYFQKRELDPKTESLVRSINSVDFIITDTEVEALVLENTLIKKHRPRYNINLRDSQKYAYIRLTGELFPRLVVARGKRELYDEGKEELFGPFVSAAGRDHILNVLNKTFKLRTCKRMPKKACLRYHIKLCDAPCIGNIDEARYGEMLKRAVLVLKGKSQELIDRMTVEMQKASTDLNFEHAMELRDQINALTGLRERQKMERDRKYNEDIINYTVKNGVVYLHLFNVFRGTLENKQVFNFEYAGGDSEEFFEEFLAQYYSENDVPEELIVPVEVGESVVSFLEMRAGKKVRVVVPQRGDKKKLLELVLKNIEITFFGDIEKLKDLKSKLKMQEMPVVIECFDISHLSGTSTVASMVQFRNALPDKSNYRRFRIKTVEGVDDFSSIAEVVKRRYSRLVSEAADLPDLILIDGGIGQLNAATAELKRLGVRVPTISIAKRFEEIYVPGADEPLILSRRSKALQLLQRVRDEAHRFAITYNRLLRKKELLK